MINEELILEIDMELNTKIFHPGETLDEKLKEMDLTPKQFSKLCGISTKTIENIIDGKRDIDDVIAMVLDDYTGIPNHFWINMQRRWDAVTKSVSPHVEYGMDKKNHYYEDECYCNKRTDELLIAVVTIQSFLLVVLFGMFIWNLIIK